ncbi:MAG: GH3 auxin-responsive promoter family protein [Leptospirales bacterium]|jgi:hypothetical protein|nr:GH3 auxin-responsive promoter family protein [Leptospirales bacterium]
MKDQTKNLGRIFRLMRSTKFASEHHLGDLDETSTPERLLGALRQVPIRSATEYEPWLADEAETAHILCAKTPDFFEETSGSVRPKLIPYTRELRREMDIAIGVWMNALYAQDKSIFQGPLYFSLSPTLKARKLTARGIPIGANDEDYLGAATRILLRYALTGRPASFRSPEDFFRKTLEQLIAAKTLSMVSVWSPTFLISLDARLREMWADLKKPSSVPARFETWDEIWPNLKMISMWTDASAAAFVPQVRSITGNIPVQGKGLLATEGITSIPILHDMDPVIAYRSHFFEFKNERGIFRLDELQAGESYEVILTTGGGLIRYATGDIVTVTGFMRRVPTIRFKARNEFSDLVGEKISEEAGLAAIHRALKVCHGICGIFLRHADPGAKMGAAGYELLLFVESVPENAPSVASAATQAATEILEQNPYYTLAIQTGQLRNLRVRFLGRDALEKMQKKLAAQAKREGTWKWPAFTSEAHPDEI